MSLATLGTSLAGSAGSVGQGALALGQSTATTGSYMGMMEAQNQEAIQSALATGKMSQERSLAEGLAKFMKATGEAVKNLA